jgi:hypothetical protein
VDGFAQVLDSDGVTAAVGCRMYVPPERLEIAFDSREWVVANTSARTGHTLTEWIPPSESRSSWTESLGATFAAQDAGNALNVELGHFRSELHAICPTLSWTTIISVVRS